MDTCTRCGSRLVEVDNPMRREVRHPRGVDCPGPLTAAEEKAQEAKLAELLKDVRVVRASELPPVSFQRWVP